MARWSLGVGASYSPEVYKDTRANKVVIPIIGYEGDHLYLRGYDAGYSIWKQDSPHNLVFRLAYDPRTLKPSDSDDPIIRQLDRRKSTALGGITYQYINQELGKVEFTLAGDVMGVHDGLYAETVYKKPFQSTRWQLTPSIGYAWNSSKLNNHLYGVSQEEANRISGIDAFSPDGDGQFFVGLSGMFYLSRHIVAMASGRYTNLEGDLEKSPILHSTDSFSFMTGLVYTF
ncbi:MipA/OmpV family protein [Vibrio ezurae]